MEKLVKTCRSALFLFLFVVFTKLFLDVLQQDSLERSAFSIFLKAFLLLVVIIVYITLFKLLQHFAPVWERYGSYILPFFLVLLFGVQMYFAHQLIIVPKYDFSSLYDRCGRMAQYRYLCKFLLIIITTIRIIWDL